VTLSITTLYYYAECLYAECHYAECHYAECHVLFIFMLSVITLSVVLLYVIILRVIVEVWKQHSGKELNFESKGTGLHPTHINCDAILVAPSVINANIKNV
jgi:hypothetical protein